MADSAAFERACECLEQRTSLNRLEARGTVRLAIKRAGLDPGHVTGPELAVVAERVLRGELTARGVSDADAVCAALAAELPILATAEAGDTPEAIFSRLGGSS